MLLAGLGGIILTLGTLAVFSPTMIGLEMSRAQGDAAAAAAAAEMMADETVLPGETSHADEEDMEEAAVKVAQRSAREDSPVMLSDQQEEHSPITRLSCDCPEVLTKGTLASVVGALAFLGFFSTTVLLVVSVWVLHTMAKQKKSETRETKRLTYPPSPPPRPEYLYRRRSYHPYETLHPADQSPPEGVYISASELNPGPRYHGFESHAQMSPGAKSSPENEYMVSDQPHGYHGFESRTQMSPGAKSSPENEYTVPEPQHRSSEAVYATMEDMSGTKPTSPSGSPVFHASPSAFHTGSPGYQSGSPGYQGGSPGYQGGSPGYPSGSPGYQGGSPAYQGGSPPVPFGSPVGSPGSPE